MCHWLKTVIICTMCDTREYVGVKANRCPRLPCREGPLDFTKVKTDYIINQVCSRCEERGHRNTSPPRYFRSTHYIEGPDPPSGYHDPYGTRERSRSRGSDRAGPSRELRRSSRHRSPSVDPGRPPPSRGNSRSRPPPFEPERPPRSYARHSRRDSTAEMDRPPLSGGRNRPPTAGYSRPPPSERGRPVIDGALAVRVRSRSRRAVDERPGGGNNYVREPEDEGGCGVFVWFRGRSRSRSRG